MKHTADRRKLQNIRAVVFDLDGVLVDSEGLHVRAWEQVFRVRSRPVPRDIEQRFIGVADLTVAEILKDENGLTEKSLDLLEEKRSFYAALVDTGLYPYPGVAEELDRLIKESPDLKLAVATSSGKEEARLMLCTSGLDGRFRTVVTADDVSRFKPEPECYLRACRELDVAPEEAAAVEDSPAGIDSARAAGMYVIAVPTTRESKELKAASEIAENTKEAMVKLRYYIQEGCV